MRVDERDDETERLREVRTAEPGLGLAGVDLVPAVAVAGVATAEVLRLRVLARVRRLPVAESELGQRRRVTRASSRRAGIPGDLGRSGG